MKKIVAILLAMMLLSCAAFAEAFVWGNVEAEESWYELSSDNTVLTVRMPGNTKSGLEWNFEISNPAALELITQEVVEGESEGMAGASQTYVASFRSDAYDNDSTSLILKCTDGVNEEPVYTRVLEISTATDNTLTIDSVLEQDPFADWVESGDNGYLLTVRMPDAAWSFQILDEEVIELLTSENDDGILAASFIATMDQAGFTEITFKSDDGMHYRTVTLFVDESGGITVEWVDTFDIFESADLVYCEVCGGWYEAGNVFRNHICIEEEPEVQATSFKTVNVTGSSVNLRSGVGTGYDIVATLKSGYNALYLNKSDFDSNGTEWYKVDFNGTVGWISSKYAKLGGHGYVQIKDGNCNLRSEANTDSKVITVISKGTIIKYLGEGVTDARGVNWYKVSISGNTGYVSSTYAKFVTSNTVTDKDGYAYVQIVNGDSHLRKNPDVDANSLGTLKKGTYCKYLSTKSTDDRGVVWYKVSVNGKEGWVSSKYAKLTNNGPVNPTPAPAPTPKPSQDTSDMRPILNPNHYDVMCVTDIFSQNGRDYYVTGYFGKVNNGVPEYFDSRNSVTVPLVPGAEVLLPSDLNDYDSLTYVTSPEIWFNNARNEYGGNYLFYARFSMNESGALRNLVFLPVY